MENQAIETVEATEVVEQTQTQEQVVAAIAEFRNGIIQTAVDKELTFDVIFNALSQVVAGFAFDLLLTTKGELSLEGINEVVDEFAKQTKAAGEFGFTNLREQVKAEQEAAAAEGQEVAAEVTE